MDHLTGRPPLAVAVLGLAERAAYVRDGHTNLFKWNVLGLKHVIVAHIYPITLGDWYLAIAFPTPQEGHSLKLRIADTNGVEAGWVRLGYVSGTGIDDGPPLRSDGPRLLLQPYGWTPAFLPLAGDNPITIQRPGTYLVFVDGANEPIGQLHFAVVDPPALTAERVAAIKSDPQAVKTVRLELGCRKCISKLRVYASLEQSEEQEAEGYYWYRLLPDEWRCECGSAVHDLTIIRRNLFGLLGRPLISDDIGGLNYLPLYEQSALVHLLGEFKSLLNQNPPEERLQKFIEENPILLHQFPAEKLFFKPPILTFFKADFAIVTPQKELVLVEIEKTSTRLLKKDGGEAAELRHAFDQVQSWLHIVDDHRLAVLDSLGIDREIVSSVRGVVIAGRDQGYDAAHLRRLKGVDRGRVSLLTYDDLAFGLTALIRRINRL